MAAESYIEWPHILAFNQTLTTWSESNNPQKEMSVAGEKLASLMYFDGSELDYIEIGLDAETQADNLELTIQLPDATDDTVNVTGFPDGTAITSSTVSVSNVGGVKEWVRFTFGATGPSPSGWHWVVLRPTSAGAFNITPMGIGDWGDTEGSRNISGYEKQYDGIDWNNGISVGHNPVRVKTKAGAFVQTIARAYSPFFSATETANARAASGTTCVGVKFTAPYDMTLAGVKASLTGLGPYISVEAVLINDSGTELARTLFASYYWYSNARLGSYFETPISLTGGNSYRLYLRNKAGGADSLNLLTMTLAAAADWALIDMTNGDFMYTTADNPPAEGGSGTWTDTTLEFPFMSLLAFEDVDTLAGGGGPVGTGGAPGLQPIGTQISA